MQAQLRAVPLRRSAPRPVVDIDADEGYEGKWSRRSRFVFIVSAASLCWLIPGIVVYLLVGPH